MRAWGPDMSERPLEESEPLRIGSRVDAVDGACGELVRVIIDPVAQKVTHLVVASRHTPAQGHLVPIDLIDSAEADEIRIHGTVESFQQLDFAQDIQFMPASTD